MAASPGRGASALESSAGRSGWRARLLDEAERLYVRNPLPDQPIAAMKARVWVRQGQLTEALGWAREQGLSPDDELSYLREFEHLTLARVLIARYRNDRDRRSDPSSALGFLDRLLQAAEDR